mmetsp:Transcript_19917/g.38601  ORF Transcript_19917/g.38601 Transcript_19917/m.38601 type:complete len:222 (+) Transcript_19917:726-1391(+)
MSISFTPGYWSHLSMEKKMYRSMPRAWAVSIKAVLPSQSTRLRGSSGRAVAQSITASTPSMAGGIEVAWPRSPPTIVAPHPWSTRRASSDSKRDRTKQRTWYPSESARRTICLPSVPVAPTTSRVPLFCWLASSWASADEKLRRGAANLDLRDCWLAPISIRARPAGPATPLRVAIRMLAGDVAPRLSGSRWRSEVARTTQSAPQASRSVRERREAVLLRG